MKRGSKIVEKAKRCQIPEFWCGEGELPQRDPENLVYHTHLGRPYECLKRGIGVGKNMGQKIPENSIRNIKYVGEKLEKRFIQMGIKTLKNLYEETKVEDFDNTLRWCCTQTDGKINKKAYNSIVWHLLNMGYSIESECYLL